MCIFSFFFWLRKFQEYYFLAKIFIYLFFWMCISNKKKKRITFTTFYWVWRGAQLVPEI